MKISYYQFETHLAKSLEPIYIISGDEPILKHEALQLLQKKASAAGFTERMRITVETGYDWGKLHHLLNSPSLLGEKYVIELDCRESLPPKLGSQLLQEYATQPSPNNILLINANKIDDKMAKSAWYKALEKTGLVVTIWPITRDQLPPWINKRAAKYKLRLSSHAANILADYVEGNLTAAAHTLEKIYLLKPSAEITPELIESIMTDESHYTVFDLVEQFISGNTSRTLHTLTMLKSEGTELTLIVWAIARELRLLIQMLEQLKQGMKYDDLWQKHRIFPKRQPNIRQFLMNTSLDTCLKLLSSTTTIDQMIKGAMPGNPWNALELLCLTR